MSSNDRETRALRSSTLRAVNESDGVHISGICIPYNSPSEDLGGFVEVVAPGACTETIAQDDIRAVYNHRPEILLGRNRSGTLVLREAPDGLYADVRLGNQTYARDLIEAVGRGDISGWSFSFLTIGQTWEGDEGEPLRRTLTKIKLFEVCPATFPAYPDTTLAIRSLDAFRPRLTRVRARFESLIQRL